MTGDSAGWQGCRIAADYLRKMGVAPDRLETLFTADVGHTPSEVVYEETTLELHRYEPDERRHETPILVVYALVNRPYILDLQPDRSVVRRLLEAGFAVYLVDWGEPTRLDTALDMSDYVGRFLDNCIDAVCADAGVEEVHLLGYCMGGTMAIMHTALEGNRVRTLGLMATPVAFEGTGGILEHWAEHFDPGSAVEALGNMPAELLSLEFSMMNPVDQYVTKYVRLYENLDDPEFVANFARMERWIWDGVDVAGAAFEEFVTEIYQDNSLVRGEYDLDGRPVRIEDIEVPVLQVVGQYDHIVPAESSEPLNDLVGSDDERLVEFPRGHIGISVSGKAHEQLWPEVCEWYAARGVGADGAPEADDGGGGDEARLVPGEPDDDATAAESAASETATARETVRRVAETARAAAGARPVEREGEESGAGGDGTATERDSGTVEEGSGDATAEGTRGDATSRGTRGDATAEGTRGDATVEEETGTGERDVETVEGIGPTYAERLREAGIETAGDLAAYDARLLAAVADAPPGRVERWLDRVGAT